MSRTGTTWWGDALRGAIAGGAGVWMMDLVTTGMQASQAPSSSAKEVAARPHGKSSTANLVDLVADRLAIDADEPTRELAAQAVHVALGVVPGALYGVARSRLPLVAAAGGLAYGAALSAINDEYLGTRLGVSGPIGAYPMETHARGLVGHLALGMTTETGIRVLGG